MKNVIGALQWKFPRASLPFNPALIPGKKPQRGPFSLPTIHHDRIPNTTIMERTGAPDIFSLLRIYLLRWSGLVCRMEDGRLQKDILYGQLPSVPRPVGRPKLRYKDVLKRDLKVLNINTENWEQLTLEHAPWRSLLQDRRACSIQTYITDCNRRRTDRRTRRERA